MSKSFEQQANNELTISAQNFGRESVVPKLRDLRESAPLLIDEVRAHLAEIFSGDVEKISKQIIDLDKAVSANDSEKVQSVTRLLATNLDHIKDWLSELEGTLSAIYRDPNYGRLILRTLSGKKMARAKISEALIKKAGAIIENNLDMLEAISSKSGVSPSPILDSKSFLKFAEAKRSKNELKALPTTIAGLVAAVLAILFYISSDSSNQNNNLDVALEFASGVVNEANLGNLDTNQIDQLSKQSEVYSEALKTVGSLPSMQEGLQKILASIENNTDQTKEHSTRHAKEMPEEDDYQVNDDDREAGGSQRTLNTTFQSISFNRIETSEIRFGSQLLAVTVNADGVKYRLSVPSSVLFRVLVDNESQLNIDTLLTNAGVDSDVRITSNQLALATSADGSELIIVAGIGDQIIPIATLNIATILHNEVENQSIPSENGTLQILPLDDSSFKGGIRRFKEEDTELPTDITEEEAQPVIGTINSRTVNVRSAGNANAARVGGLSSGNEVTIIGTNEDGDWYAIEFTDANGEPIVAWVFAELVDVDETAASGLVTVDDAGNPIEVASTTNDPQVEIETHPEPNVASNNPDNATPDPNETREPYPTEAPADEELTMVTLNGIEYALTPAPESFNIEDQVTEADMATPEWEAAVTQANISSRLKPDADNNCYIVLEDGETVARLFFVDNGNTVVAHRNGAEVFRLEKAAVINNAELPDGAVMFDTEGQAIYPGVYEQNEIALPEILETQLMRSTEAQVILVGRVRYIFENGYIVIEVNDGLVGLSSATGGDYMIRRQLVNADTRLSEELTVAQQSDIQVGDIIITNVLTYSDSQGRPRSGLVTTSTDPLSRLANPLPMNFDFNDQSGNNRRALAQGTVPVITVVEIPHN